MRPTQNNVLLKGSSGCGKSYFLVDWIWRELMEFSDALIVTNLPLGVVPKTHFVPPAFEGETFIDRIGKRVGKDISHRFMLLDEEELEDWKAGKSGPWSLELPSKEKYMIVDEFADYCHRRHENPVVEKWISWFAKARHCNCWNLCISQSDKKIPRVILPEFGERWQMSDTASQMLPGGVLEGDVNQILSKLFKKDFAATQVIPRIDEGGTMSSRSKAAVYRVWRRASGYALYDSFSAPDPDSEGTARLKTWQRLSWPELLSWFVSRNAFFCCKIVFVSFVLFLAFYYVVSCYLYFVRPRPSAVSASSSSVSSSSSDDDSLSSSASPSSESPSSSVPRAVGSVNGSDFFVLGNRRWLSFDSRKREGIRVASGVGSENGNEIENPGDTGREHDDLLGRDDSR